MLQLSSLLCGRHGNFQSPSSPYAAAAAHRQVKPKPGLKYTNAVFQFNKNKRNWKRRKHWNASVEQAFTWLLGFIGQLQCRWPLQCHWAECRDFSSSLPCKASTNAGTAAAKSPGGHSPVRQDWFSEVQVQESTGAGQNRNRHAALWQCCDPEGLFNKIIRNAVFR